MEIAFNNQEY